MIEAPHYSASGSKHKSGFALPADLFDGTVHEAALHQAVKTYLGNQRQGTAKTKTRSFISGGNKKPWRQKGTGRARQGSIRSPLWRGGGIVFGPIPRDYRAALPRKIRSLARRSAFNARAREGNLFVVDPVSLEAPKTRELAGLLDRMGLEGRKVLVLTNGLNRNLYLSGRNLPQAQVMSFAEASAYDIIWADALVVEQGALGGEVGGDSEVGADGGVSASRRQDVSARPKAKAVKKPAAKKSKAAETTGRRAAGKKPAAKKSKAAEKKSRAAKTPRRRDAKE
jgi:large subunit ribosomal protein L4